MYVGGGVQCATKLKIVYEWYYFFFFFFSLCSICYLKRQAPLSCLVTLSPYMPGTPIDLLPFPSWVVVQNDATEGVY